MNAIKKHYKVTIDWGSKLYCGLNLNWNDKEGGYLQVSMKNYVQHEFTKFNHTPPEKPQHAPHAWYGSIYDHKVAQLPTPVYQEPPIDKKVTHRIQSIVGTFLYYSEINPCIKPATNKISYN